MPELPEVETLLRQLQPIMVGRTIERLEILRPDYVHGISAVELADLVRDKKVTALRRQGKAILVDLGDGGSLAIRLGMSGKILLCDPDAELARHTHWRMRLDGEPKEIRGVDARRFGKLIWLTQGQLTGMGVDASKVRAGELGKRMRGRKIAVHSALLDQKILAGVGNIYASEALHHAGINPLRPAGSLTRAELVRLTKALDEVLSHAIALGGSSISDYVDVSGRQGGFAAQHRVYGRQGEPCQSCHSGIKRVVRGGRSIFYCPTCQPDGE